MKMRMVYKYFLLEFGFLPGLEFIGDWKRSFEGALVSEILLFVNIEILVHAWIFLVVERG